MELSYSVLFIPMLLSLHSPAVDCIPVEQFFQATGHDLNVFGSGMLPYTILGRTCTSLEVSMQAR